MEDQQQIQNPDLEIIPEESRSHAIPMNKEEIQERLQQLKIQAKKEMNSEIENQFVDLLSAATQFYGDEMAYELAQFYYEYGSALLNRLVNNTDDIFGDLLKKQQKKEEENQDEEQQQDYQNDEEQENQTESKYQQENKQEQHQQINKQEIKEQKVVFKDQDVEIVDENQLQNSENQQQQQKAQKDIEQLKNNGQNEKQQLQQQQEQEEETKENQNKEEDADDMQISYENLYTALRIGEKDLENVKRQYSDDQIKQDPELRQKVIFLADCCNRLGEFENWREKFDDALEYLGKAQDYLQKVLNPNSREIATNKFMQANTILYKQESDETSALKYFIECISILENILSKQCSLPIKEFPSAENIKKEDLETEHLKETFLDSQENKELKQTIKQLYEKIEDTILQREQKIEFEKEQQKMKKQQDQANQFQPVDPNKVQIKNLGIIGNAKKRDPNGVKKITFSFAPAGNKINNNNQDNNIQNQNQNQHENGKADNAENDQNNNNNVNNEKQLLGQPSPALQEKEQLQLQKEQEQKL